MKCSPVSVYESLNSKHQRHGITYIIDINIDLACSWRLCCCCYYLFCCCCCESGGIKITKNKFVSRFQKWLHLVRYLLLHLCLGALGAEGPAPAESPGATVRARPQSHRRPGEDQSQSGLHVQVQKRLGVLHPAIVRLLFER